MLKCLHNLWVNWAHPIGRNEGLFIGHFPDASYVNFIISNTKNLKGTGYLKRLHEGGVEKSGVLMAVRKEIERL